MVNYKTEKGISTHLKPLFWSYDFETLSLEKNKKLVVKQILNYGDIDDWKWLVSVYGKGDIQNTISKIYESELRPASLKLAKLLFNSKPKYASRHIG